MNDIENILDLNASEIDELIQTLKEIEDLALSSDGLGQINMVIDLFETNLDGLYKKAMVEQVKVRKQTFIEVIEELRDRRIRLERYREFLQSGAKVKVVQNQNYINVNPIEDMKNASDLELAIGTLIPKIQDDYDVIREADNEIDELEAIIASKLRQEPPADVSHERELISILNTNKGLFNALDSSIPESLTNTSKMPEDFDEVNKLFRTDLDNYHRVWDSTTDYKIEEMGILSGIGNFFGFGKEEEIEVPDGYKLSYVCLPDGTEGMEPDIPRMKELLKSVLEELGINVDNLTDEQIIWIFEQKNKNSFAEVISGKSRIGTQLEVTQRDDNMRTTGYENHFPIGSEYNDGYLDSKEYYIGEDGLCYFSDGNPPFPICFLNYEASVSFGIGAGDIVIINGQAYVVESAFSNYGIGTVDTNDNAIDRGEAGGPQIEIPSEDERYASNYATDKNGDMILDEKGNQMRDEDGYYVDRNGNRIMDIDGNTNISAIQMSDDYLENFGIDKENYHTIQESGVITESETAKDEYEKIKDNYVDEKI